MAVTEDQTTEAVQIGEVASRVGLSLRSVRYYEEAGLVRPAKRTVGGFRLYGEEEIASLALVKQMKPLGFSLKEMRHLLRARERLQRLDPDDPRYQKALERLSKFVATTKDRCEDLRAKLETAEGFAAELESDLFRHAEPDSRP